MSETDPHTSEIDEKARRNWPDVGGPSWHESIQQRQQEYNQQRHKYEARLRDTLLSAIQRGVIPDIWNLPDHDGVKGDHERLYFLNILENPSQRLGGARHLDTEYSDDDLRHAWRRTQNDFEELRRDRWNKAYAYAVSTGLLPSPESTDPDLYRRYYLEAFKKPLAPIPEYLQVWEKVKAEWETANTDAQQRKGGGRPRSKCNVWAREQFEQGKGIREIQDEYIQRYNNEKPDNATPPKKDLQRVYKEWLKKARNT